MLKAFHFPSNSRMSSVEESKRKKKKIVQVAPAYTNKTCPICLSDFTPDEKNVLSLSCLHAFHNECLAGITKKECPMCRTEITNLPSDLDRKIDGNVTAYREERDAEEQRQILEQLMGAIRPMPNIEVLLALKYLESLAIPQQFIPQHVRISINPQAPLPEPGVIYNAIIAKTVEVLHLDEEERRTLHTSPLPETNEPHIDIHMIQNRTIEEDLSGEAEDEDIDYEEYDHEEADVPILRTVRTVPLPDNEAAQAIRVNPLMFTVFQFLLDDIPNPHPQ